ncbi:hypothetical protein BJY04DRAFT_217818 [Aspergillus karnatakaensis]|uniref:uncharacterized protein n=1 Tax=Aspergillus karnatakaensis TaxID=1810916 RepID=UPI003CCDFBC1
MNVAVANAVAAFQTVPLPGIAALQQALNPLDKDDLLVVMQQVPNEVVNIVSLAGGPIPNRRFREEICFPTAGRLEGFHRYAHRQLNNLAPSSGYTLPPPGPARQAVVARNCRDLRYPVHSLIEQDMVNELIALHQQSIWNPLTFDVHGESWISYALLRSANNIATYIANQAAARYSLAGPWWSNTTQIPEFSNIVPPPLNNPLDYILFTDRYDLFQIGWNLIRPRDASVLLNLISQWRLIRHATDVEADYFRLNCNLNLATLNYGPAFSVWAYAVEHNTNIQILDWLNTHAPAGSINAVHGAVGTSAGTTPVAIACDRGNLPFWQRLIAHGADTTVAFDHLLSKVPATNDPFFLTLCPRNNAAPPPVIPTFTGDMFFSLLGGVRDKEQSIRADPNLNNRAKAARRRVLLKRARDLIVFLRRGNQNGLPSLITEILGRTPLELAQNYSRAGTCKGFHLLFDVLEPSQLEVEELNTRRQNAAALAAGLVPPVTVLPQPAVRNQMRPPPPGKKQKRHRYNTRS